MKRLLGVGLALGAMGGCSDALQQDTTAGQVVAVVNTGANTVSLVSATRFSVFSISLVPPAGTPTTIDARGSVLVVPLGPADAVKVAHVGVADADLTIPLASGSGATGVAIQDDSLAWVANPNLNTVTLFDYRRGDTLRSVPVGVYPQAVAVVNGRVLVLNGNLAGGAPAGPSWITSFHCCQATAKDSIPLSGTNARFATLGADGLLYVVNSGAAGAGNGKLSIVDPALRAEVAVINGLGESPGPAAYHPSGRLLVASRAEGILEVNALTRSITHGPGAGIKPGGDGVSSLAVDFRGRVYAVAPKDCVTSGVVHVLSGPPDFAELETVTVGLCPSAAALAFAPSLP